MSSVVGTLNYEGTLSDLELTCRKLCSTPDLNLNTPLHVAAKMGHLNVVKLLLDERLVQRGHVTLDAKNETYKTPAHLAAENGHARLVILLIMHESTLLLIIIKVGTVSHTTCCVTV